MPGALAPGDLGHRRVLALAVPIMLSNVSTPLIGVVDTAVVGRLPGAEHVGAVALGSLIFSLVFWAFGFLRMATTGLTSQADGAGDGLEVRAALLRAGVFAAAIGLPMMTLGPLVRSVSLWAVPGSIEVEGLAADYIDVRIFAAPATFANYALTGWFIGLGRSKTALILQLVLNLTNMALDAVLVLHFDLGVAGVAWGTVAAETVAACVGVAIAWRAFSRLPEAAGDLRARVFDRERLGRAVSVSGDIMVRSLALVVVFVFVSARGAAESDVVLAANAVLMHFIDTSAYFLDGLAYAAETLVGRAVGAGDATRLRLAVRRTTLWAAVFAGVATLLLLAFGPTFIDALTLDPATRTTARTYRFWAVFAPLLGVLCFQLDGIFIGATEGRTMRNAMLTSTAIFFAAFFLLRPFGNHGLWAAFYVHYLARTLTLGRAYPGLVRRTAALKPRSRAAS
ncbi:MAG: MATE family efflux transporter [Myxococcota bacterium]